MGDDVYTGKNGKKTAPTTHLIIKWPKNVFNGLKTADFACGEPFFTPFSTTVEVVIIEGRG